MLVIALSTVLPCIVMNSLSHHLNMPKTSACHLLHHHSVVPVVFIFLSVSVFSPSHLHPFPTLSLLSVTHKHTHILIMTLGFGQERWSLNSLYETVKENSICYTFLKSSINISAYEYSRRSMAWPRDLIIVSNIVTIGIFYLIQTTASLRIQNATFVNWKIARATKMWIVLPEVLIFPISFFVE